MTTDSCVAIYINDNGRCTCAAHAGDALRASIAADTTAQFHTTPFGLWQRFTAADFAELGWSSVCEVCDRGESARLEWWL